jgi:hypothetical protein
MTHLRVALFTCIFSVSLAATAAATELLANRPPTTHPSSQLIRQHCKFEALGAVQFQYCAAECGSGYQFYYCSEKSFGCCHVGVGYCDWTRSLRCSPWRWIW